MTRCDEPTRARFDEFMLARPHIWREQTGLTHWSRFLQLVRNHGGIDAARTLLLKEGLTDGFVRLKEAGRLDLTVEFEILQPDFSCCFSADERRLARVKLVENGLRRADLPLEPTCT